MHASDALLDGTTFEAPEGERAEQRVARLRQIHARTIPTLRLLGGNFLILGAILHNAWIIGAVDWGMIGAFTAFVEIYALSSWGALARWYHPDRRPDLSLVFLVADLVALGLTIVVTGATASWLFWIPLFRVVDQTSTYFRRALVFTVLGTLTYVGVVAWSVSLGHAVSPAAEAAKIVFILLGGTYMSFTARTAERVRERLAHAIRVARQSVDDLKAQSTELARAREQAEEGSRAKSAFLSRVSHELRTPMNAILGFAQLLEMERDLKAEQRAHVEEIMEGGRHLLDIINEVLDIARVETGSLAQEIEPVELDRAIGDVLERAAPAAARRSVTIPDAPPPGSAVWVAGSPRKVRQVVANLVSNAIKYNSPSGRVDVSVDSREDRVRVSVSDTGPGIPEEQIEAAFTPFDRLGAERHEVEGTGLGLAVARSLVEAMNGRIGVETEVGEGSTFWFELRPARPPEPDEPDPDDESSHQGGPLILYIDDKPENVMLVRRILARRPTVELDSAPLGLKGLEVARSRRPDLILLDMELPDIAGREVLTRLMANVETRDIPVVMVSAEASRTKVERLLEDGARAYFTMPYDVAKFLETVDELLRLS